MNLLPFFRRPTDATASAGPSRRSALVLLLGASGFFLGSVLLILVHASAIRNMRDVTLPLAADIPALEQRLTLLKGQIELSQLQASLRTGSPEEKLQVYVLPQQIDLDRLIAVFDIVHDALQRSGLHKAMSPLQFGDAVPFPVTGTDRTLSAHPLTVSFTVREEGMKQLLTLLKLSGLLTVGDTLSVEQMKTLFQLTESENPTGITALEPFLGADLASYIREPRPYDDRLLKSFSAETFIPAFHKLMDQSLLPDAKNFLSHGIGSILVDRKLWPLPFLLPQTVSVEDGGDGWVKVGLTVEAFGRDEGIGNRT